MKYKGEENKIGGIIGFMRVILLLLIAILAYGIGIFPAILFPYFMIKYFFINVILPYTCHRLSFTGFSLLLSSAFFINVFRLKYDKEGEYRKTLDDKMAFKFTAYFALYYPVYKLINLFISVL